MNQKSILEDTSTVVGSTRINERKDFINLYINDGKIYKVSIASLEELIKGKKRFIEVLG